ncbi:MAG: rhodanese-like domain-containing protein [Gemmatimonadaceae bacterium]
MAKSGTDLVNEAKQRITEIDPAEARAALDSADTVFVDVREPNEYNLGRVPGALPLPRGTIETRGEGMLPRDKTIVVYCGGGSRSALAADTLQTMGYDVRSLRGGYRAWVEGDGPIES